MRLQPELVQSIHRILDEPINVEEPLDSLAGDFDPISTLNQLIPNEEALGNIEKVQEQLQHDKEQVQQELDLLLGELQADQDPERMQIIQELISELLLQLNRIREKASESEAIVREITKDIQALDLAKKNILQSVTTLKRFQMLANAVAQLERLIPTRKYAEISQTLSAMKEVAAVFKQYTAVERIATIWKRVQELQAQLRSMVDDDFDALFLHDASKEVDPSSLSDACLVVDVLGPEVRNHLIDRYCSIELREYRRIFRSSDEAGQLDNISRRFAWFRRILANHEEERAPVFPPGWKVAEHLFARFSEITRDDMAAALSKAGSPLTVTLVLDALRQTLEFEQSMATKFSMPILSLVQLSALRGEAKTISSSFDAHMGIFVDAQDKILSDMMSVYRGPKARSSLDDRERDPSSNSNSDETPVTVLPSSTELFYFYGQTLDQCARFSTKKVLFDLANTYKRWLRKYADEVLVASLKRPERERKSLEGRLNPAEIRNACLVLNTAEYCQITASQLEDRIRDKIADEYKEQISFQGERDTFVGVISAAIASLLRELESACEPHFSSLTRTLWVTVKNVSSQSPYVSELVGAIDSVVESARELIEKKKYLKNFYDKAASLVLAKFANAVVKSRPIKEAGAQQLLLDLQTIKATLLRIPDPHADLGASSTYSRNITTSSANFEKLLKIVDVPVNPPDEFIQNYAILIGDMSYSNFQKVLDLKGTPKVEQGSLLDTFVTTTSTMEHLEPTSFLSSVDMDPPAQVQPHIVTATSSGLDARSLFGGLTSPPPESGPTTPTLGGIGLGLGAGTGERREVFSDLKRLVTFAVRRDREPR